MAGAVLDASALLALLGDEPGADVVAEAIREPSALSIVNVAEVLSKLAERGADPGEALARLEEVAEALEIHPLDRADAIAIADLRGPTRALGLSMGDRACLALALRLEMPALTADRGWSRLEGIGVEIMVIR